MKVKGNKSCFGSSALFRKVLTPILSDSLDHATVVELRYFLETQTYNYANSEYSTLQFQTFGNLLGVNSDKNFN